MGRQAARFEHRAEDFRDSDHTVRFGRMIRTDSAVRFAETAVEVILERLQR